MSTQARPTGPEPLIPTSFLDVPSQRLYFLSIGILCQAIKLFDFFRYLTSSDESPVMYGAKWILVDFIYCTTLSRLRIPRINYGKAVVILQIVSLWFLDGVLFGGLSLNVLGHSAEGQSLWWRFNQQNELPATPNAFSFSGLMGPLSLISSSSVGSKDGHLVGQHTIRMSPISTAQLNPSSQTFCLASPGSSVLIPILLNNTNPTGISYSLIPLGFSVDDENARVERIDLSARDLKSIEQSRRDALQLVRQPSSNQAESDEYDDDEEDDFDEGLQSEGSRLNLQKTQSITHIRVTKPGTIRLERVRDASNVNARLSYPLQMVVAPCPNAEFAPSSSVSTAGQEVYCFGQKSDRELMIDVSGVPPLSLKWIKSVNGRREQFLVEGIEGERDSAGSKDTAAQIRKRGTPQRPQQMRVPLTASLNALGTHTYALEEVTDAVGNTVHITGESTTNPKVQTRSSHSMVVLRRPSVSFKSCRPENPKALRIGGDTPLVISANEADMLDAPWEVSVQYQPLVDAEDQGKRVMPWKKTLKTVDDKREVTLQVNTPGSYSITGVKGKWCEGDVLAPDLCRVVEQPRPTAEIEWKRIHECSGDTGVSASIVLHGTPPFRVAYRTQRDKEQPKQETKTFNTFRGELSLQPERSGHYVYTFVEISDANYQKVELKGPSIDQIVHPLASAEFVGTGGGERGSKRRLSNCAGSSVDVEVALKGTGPWNLQLQVVGPRGSDVINIPGITESHKVLSVPIPKVVDKHGGNFEIDLVNVEDANGCKRPIFVPGVAVTVRRIKPTAKFYSHNGKRQATILEREKAQLPLRLTGDGPWTIKYKRTDGDHIASERLTSPNAQLVVSERGTYEIVEVNDSQCPGEVIAKESSYTVDWVPRPSAHLSPSTPSHFEPYNGSHILPPVCEGLEDHVDLDLTGSSPFQIMYNIARGNDAGGTRLLDQPTFNSIQPRTRFQLHTSTPGRMFYEVKQIGDVSYPLAKHKDSVIPRSQRLLFEQQVSKRPTAQFKSRARVSYCFNDMFIPRDTNSDAQIVLDGTPPFRLQLAIKSLATGQKHVQHIEVSETSWLVSLPEYEFKSIGSHLVNIETVQDASNCAPATMDPLTSSIWVDVSETAAISPLSRGTDFCVGDVTGFQLEGTPPWSIGYRINGKSLTQEAKSSPFSLLQQQAGEFKITSISHQQKLCKAAVTDLHFTVHDLPSAQIGHGKPIYEDIHEGDQARIVFTLIGEPPFTFTYQRSEPSAKKGGKPGKVLETHTVSRVMSNEYSVSSASEGTWTVTSISDKYCRYPPAQSDTEKHKH